MYVCIAGVWLAAGKAWPRAHSKGYRLQGQLRKPRLGKGSTRGTQHGCSMTPVRPGMGSGDGQIWTSLCQSVTSAVGHERR